MPVVAVATARAYMYTPKNTCHGSSAALPFLDPPGYQNVVNPSPHCSTVTLNYKLYITVTAEEDYLMKKGAI